MLYEVITILKNDFLSEEQQYRLYRSIVQSQNGKPVILRTADIGGDKLLQGRSAAESNPFLGVRGIRFSLANLEMFRDQLRAMLSIMSQYTPVASPEYPKPRPDRYHSEDEYNAVVDMLRNNFV